MLGVGARLMGGCGGDEAQAVGLARGWWGQLKGLELRTIFSRIASCKLAESGHDVGAWSSCLLPPHPSPPITASQPPFAWAFSNKSLELQRELFEVCLSGFHARRRIYHTCIDQL